MKVTLAIIGTLLVAACAPVTERQTDARQYRQVDWENRYTNYARRCVRAGGRMIVRATGRIGRSGIPNRGDYYSCSRPIAADAQN